MSRIQIYRHMRRRWRGPRLLIMISIFVFGYLGTFMALNMVVQSNDPLHQQGNFLELDERSLHRKLLQSTSDPVTTVATSTEATTVKRGLYPNDLFTPEQLSQGALTLYVLGIMYMFVALAIVCDEFFVPALEVIIEKLAISEDVAGATFMAAGGSAPELFTSIIGVFIAFSDVGIGTIVGSAVFNILFVIGMCAMFSKGVLELTWWPLFRDVTFYSISLICLIIFFQDEHIEWYESVILLCCYVSYVIFMKFNAPVEQWVKSKIQRNRVTTVRSTDNLINSDAARRKAAADGQLPPPQQQQQQQPPLQPQNGALPALKGSHKFRHGLLQLMIHTIDPLGEATADSKVHDRALKLHAVASLKAMATLNQENHDEPNENNKNGAIPAISNGQVVDGENTGGAEGGDPAVTTRQVVVTGENNADKDDPNQINGEVGSQGPEPDEDDDDSKPLDLSWPKTWRKRITYILVAPLIFPLFITLPDPRRPSMRKFFPWTFLGSIIWIAVFSYLMTWWATVVGQTIGIPDAVMGLTFLAAGTSIPDLITSVIVAKKGFGDMAVSSSVGSNIFDVTVGLPFPWLMYNLIFQSSYSVSSKGLFCSIILLFLMLILVVSSIAIMKWKMNKLLGSLMFVFYFIFVALSLLLEYKVIKCAI